MVQCYSFKIPNFSSLIRFLFVLFVILPVVLHVDANNITAKQNDYVEGKLYVEIKARYQNMNWEYDQEMLKPKNHGLKRLIMQYQITKIEKAEGKKQKNAYYFHFKKTHLTEAFIETLKDMPYIQKVAQIPIDSTPIQAERERELTAFEASRKPNLILIPTAFSPNNDGSNDYFEVRGQNILSYELQIFNRFGEVVCQITESDLYGWDGIVNGQSMPTGIYAYYGWVRFENGENKILKGYLTLME